MLMAAGGANDAASLCACRILAGDIAEREAAAYGEAVHEEGIVNAAIELTGHIACRPQARDGLAIGIEHARLFIDDQAGAHGRDAQVTVDAVKRGGW